MRAKLYVEKPLIPDFVIVSNHHFKNDIYHSDQILQFQLTTHSLNNHIYPLLVLRLIRVPQLEWPLDLQAAPVHA